MDNHTDRYIGQMLDGRYEILEVIGHGGMAVVYKARCHLLNRYVAVKILRDEMAKDSDFRLHFKKEAQAVAMLSHANIVSIYDVSRTPDVDYIVMELLEGLTLKQYMKSKGALSCKESVHIATQIARALTHAHSKGIIHRDIKPQNIMIGLDGIIKVADFGIAHLESSLGENKETVVGSIHYISPEQAKGESPDARSDIYSLGVVMYEMLTGKLPYTGSDAESIARQHVEAALVPPREINPDIPEELESIVLKAMNADITQRYQSAGELLADLDEYRLSFSGTVPDIEAKAEEDEEIIEIPEDVPPISRSGEMTKESYARRHRRAKKVSLLTGFLLVLVFAIAVFSFLWSYWLQDLFSTPVKVSVPNFVGSEYEDIINDKELTRIYNFTVFHVVNADVPAGTIIKQDPQGGKSRTQDSDGIDVELTVSAGAQLIIIPDVTNKEYREATNELQHAGFVVGELDYATSDSITQDYVISTSPEAGDKLPAGATVYITVSAGPNVVTLPMPNLIGLSQSEATSRLESLNLSLGTITYVESELPKDTVIWQSVDAFKTVNEHTRVYLQVSSGMPEPEEEAPSEDPLVPVAPYVVGG